MQLEGAAKGRSTFWGGRTTVHVLSGEDLDCDWLKLKFKDKTYA